MNSTEENRYLNEELERLKREQEDRDDREYEEQKRRREQRRVDSEESLRNASTWNEAFENGLVLIGREVACEKKFNDEIDLAGTGLEGSEPSKSFEKWKTEVETARSIYQEEMRFIEEQIKELRAVALTKTADRLAIISGESRMVQALRENNPGYLTEW